MLCSPCVPKAEACGFPPSFRAIVELKHALEENGVARGPLLSTNTDKNDVSFTVMRCWGLFRSCEVEYLPQTTCACSVFDCTDSTCKIQKCHQTLLHYCNCERCWLFQKRMQSSLKQTFLKVDQLFLSEPYHHAVY